MDIGAGMWKSELLRRFNLENQLPALDEMGTYIGEDKEKIVYALGAHDHISGVFCVKTLVKDHPFVFDSIGSTESLVTLTNSRKSHQSTEQICIGAFGKGIFYALNFIINSGLLMKCIARLGGNETVEAFFSTVNNKLQNLDVPPEQVFPIIAGGDPIIGLEKSHLSFINFPVEMSDLNLVHSVYVYMATMAEFNIKSLYNYTGPDAIIIAGGGGTANHLYLQYRAAICKKPIHILPACEMSAIGASLCAAKALGDEEAFLAFRQNRNFNVILPDNKWGDILCRQSESLLAFYQDMKNKTILELCL
jgi:sugar (pentulose or hexulose) kinase